jgi:hypothetical protein
VTVRWLDAPDSPVRWLEALPSGESAEQLVSGDISALPKVAFHTATRAGLIGLAMYVAGMHAPKMLLRYSVAGALGIEAFVLLWALYEKNKGSST